MIRNFRNSIRTPLVFDKEGVVSVPILSHWEKPLGQAQPVPVGQADWDRMYLSQWDRLCLSQTCPTGTGKGQKRPVLVPWTSHIPTLEASPCRRTSSMTTMEPVQVQLVSTCPTKWDYKAVKDFQTKDFGVGNQFD